MVAEQSTAQERGPGASEAPIGELVEQLSEQLSRLARQEVELARAELQVKGRRAGIGVGMFGGAGLFGLYALGALVAAAVLGLATAVTAWLAALIVGTVLATVAVALVLQGHSNLRVSAPPVSERATESVKEDAQWAKSRAQVAGR